MAHIPAIIAKNEVLGRTALMRERAKSRPPLTPERLREILNYDPDSGKFRWIARPANRVRTGEEAGSLSGKYIEIGIDGRRYLAHRLAWFFMTGAWPERQIDHRDLCKTNNQWTNLREASHGQNVQNIGARKNNKCGLKGVSFCRPAKKWHSRIMHKGELHLLGYFDSPEDAHLAYAQAASRLHGEFARSQ